MALLNQLADRCPMGEMMTDAKTAGVVVGVEMDHTNFALSIHVGQRCYVRAEQT